MGSINSVDVRIADFLKRILNYYIRKRTFVEPLPTQEEIWLTKFSNQDYFKHKLTDDIEIKLFKDSILCRLIYFGYEETELRFLKKYLKYGDTFLDIGANIGLFSLHASKIIGDTGIIYSFEPTPNTFSRLLENVKLNNYKNIKSYNIGFSNKKMIADFNTSNDGHDAWNSLANLNILKGSTSIRVEVSTLDSFINENSINRIDLIKLDVEGWEKFVLQGGNELLKRIDSPVFMVEFTEENAFSAGYYCGEIYDFMEKFGYQWYSYDILNNTLKKEAKKLHYPYDNLIAVKNTEDCISRIML